MQVIPNFVANGSGHGIPSDKNSGILDVHVINTSTLAMNIDSNNLTQTCFDLSKQVTQRLFEHASQSGNLAMPLQITLYPYFYEFLQQDNAQTYEMNCHIISEALTNNLMIDLSALLRSSIDACLTPEFYQNKAHEWKNYKYTEWGYEAGHTYKGEFTTEIVQKGFHDCFERMWSSSSKAVWGGFEKYDTDMIQLLRDHLHAIFEHAAMHVVQNAIAQAQSYHNAIAFHEQQLWTSKTQAIDVAPLSVNGVRQHRTETHTEHKKPCTLK